jgi:hypothetical protein
MKINFILPNWVLTERWNIFSTSRAPYAGIKNKSPRPITNQHNAKESNK